MSEMQFSNNFHDLSVRQGVNAGFQFEFYCERCGDAFRSEFVSYQSARASTWLHKASGFLGSVVGNVGEAAEGLAEAGYGKAHDDAFRTAIESAKSHFHRCGRCSDYFCSRCWNTQKGLCLKCAPSAETEVEAARAEGEMAAVREAAIAEGQQRGKKIDVKRDRQLVCPECGAETHGAKFCPECGAKLATKSTCPACQAEVDQGMKFCPECGHKMAS